MLDLFVKFAFIEFSTDKTNFASNEHTGKGDEIFPVVEICDVDFDIYPKFVLYTTGWFLVLVSSSYLDCCCCLAICFSLFYFLSSGCLLWPYVSRATASSMTRAAPYISEASTSAAAASYLRRPVATPGRTTS